MRLRRRAGGTRRGDSFAPCSEDTRRGLSSRPHIHRRIRRLSRKFPCRCPLLLPSGNGSLFLGRSRLGHRPREHPPPTPQHHAPPLHAPYPPLPPPPRPPSTLRQPSPP